MKSLKSKLSKLSVFAFIGAFSFGLAISCVSNHKQNINKVFADESDGTWTLSNGSLSFQYTDWQTNGYVTETNQIMVYGYGDGNFDIGYELLGSPPGATTAGTEFIAEKRIQLAGGYWTPSETGGYGTVSGYPVDVNGLDSGTFITLNINVQYSGTMNEQGSGEGDDENAGTWTWNVNTQKLSFQFNDTATAGYVSTTSQTMVYGHGNGTFDIGYDLYGTPAGATSASNDLLASKTITLYDGYYDEDQSTVTGNCSEISGLESYGEIRIDVSVQTSGTMNSDGWRVNDGKLYFYILDEEYQTSIDSITWNNSSGNGTGEAILSVTFSLDGGASSSQQAYQINNPLFNPELEGTSGTTSGNTTVEGISEWSDRPVTLDIPYTTYSLGESTQEIRYTITYYPNGADGEPANDFTDQVPEGDTAEYMLLENMFSRPNYIFLGWSTDSSSQIPNYEEGEKVYLRSDISYYAVWEYQEPEYYSREICFDPANGDNYITRVVEGETLPLSYEISEDLTPTYEGHTFLGWYYDGINYQPGEVITGIYESIVLVAQWEAVAQEIRYTITYYPNGAVGSAFEGYTEYTLDGSSGVNYTFERCPDDYYMEGCYFAGWSSSQGGEEAEFIAGETYLVNQDLHVYAVWVLEEQDPETQAEITSLELLENPQAYYLVGDVIDFTNIILVANYSDGSTKEVYSNEYVAYFRPEGECDPYQPLVSGDYSLYFTYEGATTERGVPIYVNERESETYEFEIIFVANDGTSETRTNSFTHSESSYTYDLPSSEQIGFTREGYSFVGWSYYSDGEVLKEAPVLQSGTTTFYAIWESTAPQGTEYIIKFNGNGATSGSMEDDSFATTYQDYQYSFPYALPECTYSRDGYAFAGWGLTETALLKWQPGETRDIEPGETTFYAIWAEIFNITFDANGGTGYMEPISVNSGTRPTVPGCDFVRDGYSFVGWAVNSPDSETIVQPEDTVSVNQDYVLYALWELAGPRYQYTVTFDGNGATSGSTDSVILSGDDYSQTIVFPVCGYEREGYIFKGWGFNSEAIMTYKPGEERTDITSDTTFYAIWTQVFTISFDANGGEGMMENITIPQGNATMPECSFIREGYSFAGWAVGSPAGDVYPTGASVYVSANYVLFATWEPITPITEIEISVLESEVILYVDDSYIVQYTVAPEDAAGDLIWKVEDEKVAAVIEDGMLVGLSVGSTTVTISDRSGNASVSFVVYVVEKPVPVQPENPISEETIENISNAMDNMDLSEEQTEKIQNVISENQEYISDETGDIIYQALLGTTISSDDPVVAEAQKELVVAVVEAGVAVDAGKATNISGAQTIDKALPENANFSVEGEIQEFYERQMAELFGGGKPTRSLSRAGTPTHGIDTDTKGKEGQEAVDYLANEQLLYKKMGDFVESGVDHMGKAALKLRKCSGEAVTVQVKSYVTRVKVSSFREFDKEAADKEFVEAAYKAILLSMQNEVISILEKEHKPSNNAEKEAQYTKELEAVKDIESFEIMVTEVLRQKYVALTGENIEDVDAFHPIYWEIFTAWALDKQSPYPITLEELTQTTIDQSTSRARTFTINSDLTGGEWGFIAGIIAGSAAIITAAAVIPTVLKKRRAKEGNK